LWYLKIKKKSILFAQSSSPRSPWARARRRSRAALDGALRRFVAAAVAVGSGAAVGGAEKKICLTNIIKLTKGNF
jgi:hypothetical protein